VDCSVVECKCELIPLQEIFDDFSLSYVARLLGNQFQLYGANP